MSNYKSTEAARDRAPDEEETPPPYQGPYDGGDAGEASSSGAAPPPVQHSVSEGARSLKPTITSPFNFPTQPVSPPYTDASSSQRPSIEKPIAIPQSRPDPAAPFLPAYPPILLRYGITAGTWQSFLETLSAFLTATVSDRAIAHAADVGKHVGNVPKSFGKETVQHAKSVGRNIKEHAVSGNVIGAAFTTVGGIVSIPVATAFRAAGALISLPFSAASAAARRPQTPRERALLYTAAANKDWFAARGLYAQLLDQRQVASLLRMAAADMLTLAGPGKDAPSILGALSGHIAELEIQESTPVVLGGGTLWLVITELAPQYSG